MEWPLFAKVKGLRLTASEEAVEESRAEELREVEVRLFKEKGEGLHAGVKSMVFQSSLDHVNIAV